MNFILKNNGQFRKCRARFCNFFRHHFTFGFWDFSRSGFSNSSIIINNKDSYPSATKDDFQEAIWFFVNGGNTPSTAIGQQIVADALSNGEGFVPSAGQWIAVVCYIDEEVQKIFIEVDP